MKKESDIQREILYYLKTLNIFVWRNNSTGIFDPTRKTFRTSHSLKGVSDILGIYKGKFLAIEVKSLKGKPTADQSYFLDTVNRQGGIGFIARSLEDVISHLKP